MTRSEIEKSLLKVTGGVPIIKLAEVSRVVRDTNKDRVKKKYLLGLERIGAGYFVPEVAQRLKDSARI